jgi:hypothetical protein
MNENFLTAYLVNNPMFSRGGNGGRNPEIGILDRNFFGHDFYDTHKERLLNLKMSNLIRDGRVVQFDTLLDMTNIPFSQVIYLRLVTAGNFAIQKYANKNGSNGESTTIESFIHRVKKGSKKFRKVLEADGNGYSIADLRVVKTFFRIISVNTPESTDIGKLHNIWSWQFLSNRIRFFAFQFYNNSLGIKSRIAGRYRNGGIEIDQRCTFCVKAGSMVPMREEFLHLFYDCPYIRPVCDLAYDIYFRQRLTDDQKRLCYLTGLMETFHRNDKFFYMLTALLINYTVWQCKQKRSIPSIATITNEVDYSFYLACFTSKKVEEMARNSPTPICRRWRDGHHGRG